MATRNFPSLPQSNILKCVNLYVTLNGNGAGNAPLLGPGDPNGTWFSAPVRTGAGIYTLTTQDAYPAYVSANLEYVLAAASATSCAVVSPKPTQNAAGQWVFTINCFTAGALADPLTTSQVLVNVTMQNTNDPYAG